MSDFPRAEGERISALAHAVISRRLNEFRDEMTLIATREVLIVCRDLVRKLQSEDAQHKSRELYMTMQAVEFQKQIDKISREIAKRLALEAEHLL